MPEAKGSGELKLALEAKGVGRGGTRARALAILGVLLCSPFFVFFISLIWVSLFMVSNSYLTFNIVLIQFYHISYLHLPIYLG